jgi:chitinase
VIWVWQSTGITQHNTTNLATLWGSGTHTAPFSFTNTFNNPGNFPYECSIHVAFGMTGAVVVASANLPPTVAITNPVSGTVFAAPASVTLQASAADSDGSVTNVQFLVGSAVLTNKATAPFSATTNSLPAGSYTLFAVASDNLGATATNQITISVVTPVLVQISAAKAAPPAGFTFSFSANTGLNYIVQRSTNLSSPWITLLTNRAGSSSINFTDQNATFNEGFYRVGRLPNP